MKKHNNNYCNHNQCLCCGWGQFQPLCSKEEELFYNALEDFCGNEFLPLLVSTQVHNGYNYLFLAEKFTPNSCKPPSLVYVHICVLHCGITKLISISDAHLFPALCNCCC